MFHSKSGMSDSAAWLKGVLKQRSGKSHTYIKNNKLYFLKSGFVLTCLMPAGLFYFTGATVRQRWVSYEQHRIILLM